MIFSMPAVLFLGFAQAFSPPFAPLDPNKVPPTETKKTPEVVDEEAPSKPTEWFTFATDQQDDWLSTELNRLGSIADETERSSLKHGGADWFGFALQNKPRADKSLISNGAPTFSPSDPVELFTFSLTLNNSAASSNKNSVVLPEDESGSTTNSSCDTRGAHWFYFACSEEEAQRERKIMIHRDDEMYQWMAHHFSATSPPSPLDVHESADWFAVNSKVLAPGSTNHLAAARNAELPKGPVDWFAFAGFGVN